MRIAVVTPYFKESAEVLRRCLASVQSQGMPVDHVLVADGHPQYWVEDQPCVTHVVLRKSAADFGDTPRSVGFVVAMRREYDIIQFLDADVVLMPGHFDLVLSHFRGLPEAEYPDLVVARRQMLRPDGSELAVRIGEDDALKHIDTSCYVFYRTAFHLGIKWSFIPKELGFMDDRVFFALMTRAGLRKVAINPAKTVGYTCWWTDLYKLAGEEPPPGSKNVEPYRAAAHAWWRTLDAHSKKVIETRLGLPIKISPEIDAPAEE
ncbi:MAG TPA: glycosyltransferase family A protein [Stellaceae bacterium]|nr:glycosyltransferase family A protein [Stellaceae bacterium]